MPEQPATIADLQHAYRDGRTDPLAVTEAALERTRKHEPALNAWILIDDARAREDAERLARDLADGNGHGALHGVPVAIKDLMQVQGWPTTFGSPLHDAEPATADAALVARLRAAGAIFPGKTNCLEFGYGIAHPDFGQTLNPWNQQRTAGGSSGGSAAAVAAGQVWGATGTDSGGSIRIPAAYCGITGLKPTAGLVPLDGVQPLSWSLDHAGPLTRGCADAAVMLEVMSGRPCRPPAADVTGLRLAVIREHAEDADLTPEVARVFERALERLAAAGATIERVSIPDLRHADDALMNVIAPEASAIHAERLANEPEGFAPETRVQLETGFALPAVAHVRAQRYRRHLGRRLRVALADADVLVSPTVPWTAGAQNPPLDDPAGAAEMRYIGPYNLTGLPALTLPCGLADDGLPVGLQLAAGPHDDERLLGIGAALESLFEIGAPALAAAR